LGALVIDMLTETSLNRITGIIIAAAIAVHRSLGPGLLESAYICCLVFELRRRGLKVEEQRPVPLIYGGVKLDCGYRLDLVVEGLVIVEVKALEKFAPIHTAQMLTYLRLTGCPVGLLLNFNVPILKEGLKRVLNTRTTRDWPTEQPNDQM
jgi:GxxExxY protein